VTSAVHKDSPHHLAHFILLILLLLVEDQDRAQLLPGIQHFLFVVYLLAQQALNFVGDAFAELIVFVDVFVVLTQGIVGFCQNFDAGFEL